MDLAASLPGRNSHEGILEEPAAKGFVPVTVGGGIGGVGIAQKARCGGADSARDNIEAAQMVGTLPERYGGQAKEKNAIQEASAAKDAISWSKEAEEAGAGRKCQVT